MHGSDFHAPGRPRAQGKQGRALIILAFSALLIAITVDCFAVPKGSEDRADHTPDGIRRLLRTLETREILVAQSKVGLRVSAAAAGEINRS